VTKHPRARKSDHQRFCRTEGWHLVRDATGRPIGHHETYELPLADGRILRTRISRPVDDTDYGSGLFAHILREQLEVSADEFWRGVRDGEAPARGAPAPMAARTLPLGLVRQLTEQVGLDEQVALGLTLEQATAALTEHWERVARDQPR